MPSGAYRAVRSTLSVDPSVHSFATRLGALGLTFSSSSSSEGDTVAARQRMRAMDRDKACRRAAADGLEKSSTIAEAPPNKISSSTCACTAASTPQGPPARCTTPNPTSRALLNGKPWCRHAAGIGVRSASPSTIRRSCTASRSLIGSDGTRGAARLEYGRSLFAWFTSMRSDELRRRCIRSSVFVMRRTPPLFSFSRTLCMRSRPFASSSSLALLFDEFTDDALLLRCFSCHSPRRVILSRKPQSSSSYLES
mmetsp:Transcript_24580/g.75942  ORF Transcript_24580/g.75942 Transcript_24580/m.75942 type:complete len:253 (+) Transcript_24580:1960-2718(+)